MPNTHLDITGYIFQANGKQYPIQAGYVKTSHLEDGGLHWDWEMALELKKTDVIPSNKETFILYPDDMSIFLRTQVIDRRKEGGLSVFTLVPFVKNVIAEEKK
jgi:hypothetical protein